MQRLPDAFYKVPLAHRALHDSALGRVENNMAAIDAAIEHGVGIEVDIQPSKDGVAMVFHDYNLDRLTHGAGPIQSRTAGELATLEFHTGEIGVPTLAQVLDRVSGQVPLLIEIKDQDGAMGPKIGPLEQAIARDLVDYEGPVAVMSFNPHAVAAMEKCAPHIPRGLTTAAYSATDWPKLDQKTRAHLQQIPDFDRVGASFISHQFSDLASERVGQLKRNGAAILCWTIRSRAEAEQAQQIAHNITFEGYLPA